MMDNYTAHLTGPVRDALHANGVLLLPLPPNTTSLVQILDVGVNKPFKDYYRREMQIWQVENETENKVQSFLP